VGTAKRERQKANRQARIEELAREARRDKTKKRGLTIGVVVIGGLILLFGLGWLLGGDDDEATPVITSPATTIAPATTISTDPSTTQEPVTTEAPTTTVAPEFEYGTAPCPEADGSTPKPDAFEGAPALCIDLDSTYTATVVTDKGEFTIDLDVAGAPGNVNNFVTLARYGYYVNTGCHRIISNFVVQCGRPGDDESAPGYGINDELPEAGSYQVGSVAMANAGANTAGGQFFVVTGADGAALPPQYTIIGTVTTGLDTTVKVLNGLADPTAANGVPPLTPVVIESITINES
jgi:cyclophilin family peptidyl-prolyl cis-trans isomerase